MTEAKAQEIVVICLFITVASTSGAELRAINAAKNLHPHRTLVGGFFAMVVNSIVAEIDAPTGAFLAIATAGYTFFRYGIPTIESYYSKQEKEKQKKVRTK